MNPANEYHHPATRAALAGIEHLRPDLAIDLHRGRCSVFRCEGPGSRTVTAYGTTTHVCGFHYGRFKADGTFGGGKKRDKRPADKTIALWSSLIYDIRHRDRTTGDNDSGCWLWGQCWADTGGYGLVYWPASDMALVHRIAAVLGNGADALDALDPAGKLLQIRHGFGHGIDLRSCYNPDHTREGTALDNVVDRILDGGTSVDPYMHAMMVLDLAAGTKPRLIAERHNVNVKTVYTIRRGETPAHDRIRQHIPMLGTLSMEELHGWRERDRDLAQLRRIALENDRELRAAPWRRRRTGA